MKKTYMQPTMKVVVLKCRKMLTASPLGFGDPVSTATGAEAPAMTDFENFGY